jgi:seryl-tRNA synthetase
LQAARSAATAAPAAAAAVQQAEAASSAAQQQQQPQQQQQQQPEQLQAEAPAFRAYIDFKSLRDNVDAAVVNCRNRLSSADPHLVARLYEEFVAAQQEADKLRASRNENSGAMKVQNRGSGCLFMDRRE